MHRRRLLLVLLLLVVAASAATPPLVRWWFGPESPLRISGVRAVEKWMPEIRAAADAAQLPDPYLLMGLVYAESRGRANAVSSIGALGLCQLMPPTAAELGERYEVVVEPLHPADNLLLGAHYLAEQIKVLHGDVDLALLAYRLGPARVKRELLAAGGREAYVAQLQGRKPSPWGYREQVQELRRVFALRDGADPSSFPAE
jgi:soluble lytic murein transglycosylase-like protein